MKQKNLRGKLISTMLVLAMCLSVVAIGPNTMEAASKTKLNPSIKKINLKYHSAVDSKLHEDGYEALEYLIDNPKKNATYSMKIKNTKIAKTAKNKGYTSDPMVKSIVYSTGIGNTTATVYEKIKNKKKTKIGTIKVAVKKAKVGDILYSALGSSSRKLFPAEIILTDYKDKYDMKTVVEKAFSNKEYGLSIKKKEYTLSFKIEYWNDEGITEDVPESEKTVTVDDKGIVKGLKYGTANLTFTATFKDGSEYDANISVEYRKSAIEKEGKYSIDNIRDYVVGLDKEFTLDDNSKAKYINFDNAATTPAFKPVEEEVEDKLETYGAIGRSYGQKSEISSKIYHDTKNKVLDFLEADPTDYTCFYVNSTTDGLNKLASALITSKNDVVLTTRIEHHANDLSWRERCKVIYAEVDEKNGYRVKYKDIEKLLKKNKVKIVSLSAASNVTGYVSEIHEVAKLAHKYGAMIVADGAQIVAHRAFSMIGDPDDPEDDIDFISFSAHKMYSPFGGGAVVGRARELYKHMPTFYGGGTVQIVADDWVHYKQDDVAVYEAGSPNYPGVIGLGKTIDVLSDVGFENIKEHEYKLNRKLLDGLKKLPNVILYGDSEKIDDRVGVITFNFTDINTDILAKKLQDMGAIGTRRGQFCAHPYVWRLMNIPDSELESFEGCADAKTPGMIRVSFGIYNTEEEIDRFFEILPKAMEIAKKETEEFDAVPEY